MVAGRSRRILYLQFADPAAYPPLEHSSKLLADRGYNVVMLGTDTFGDKTMKMPHHSRVRIKKLPIVSGNRRKLQYTYFFFWTFFWSIFWRPEWIYASDPLCLPAVWAIRKFSGARIIYHEHDAPNELWVQSPFMRLALACRKSIARSVELCVVPQQGRLAGFLEATRRQRPTLCVWNCPGRDEIAGEAVSERHPFVIHYHGSINRSRLPPQLIVAASRFKGAIRVRIAGYETGGSIGYVRELIDLAAQNGAVDLIEFLGTTTRGEALKQASKAHLGLSLMPRSSDDINLQRMVGASNKPFEYMASGLPLLVSDLPEWIETFVMPGYGRACNPEDADSIETELRWYIEHPAQCAAMGRRCREKIRTTWNYERFFTPVLQAIETV
jgi:glycosyltransferase involved in cell wall biosynthesis